MSHTITIVKNYNGFRKSFPFEIDTEHMVCRGGEGFVAFKNASEGEQRKAIKERAKIVVKMLKKYNLGDFELENYGLPDQGSSP